MGEFHTSFPGFGGKAGSRFAVTLELYVFVIVVAQAQIHGAHAAEGGLQASFDIYAGLLQVEKGLAFLTPMLLFTMLSMIVVVFAFLMFLVFPFVLLMMVIVAMARQSIFRLVAGQGEAKEATLTNV